MSVAGLSVDGPRRIRIGLTLLRRAGRDALRGAGLVFSGIGGVVSNAVREVWTFAGDLVGQVPGLPRIAVWVSRLIADATRRVFVAFARGFENGVAFAAAALKIAFWALQVAALGAVLLWLLEKFARLLQNLDWKAALGRFLEAIPLIPGMIFVVGATFLAFLFLNWLFGRIGRFFTPVRVRRVIVGAAIVSALGVFAAIVFVQAAPEISPPPFAVFANVALFAAAALFAGFAGVALISFGRAGVAAISIGASGKAHADAASETLRETHERVKPETALRQEEPPTETSPEPSSAPAEPTPRAPRSRLVYRLTAMGLAAATVAALAALWLRFPERNERPLAGATPSASESAPTPRKASSSLPIVPPAGGSFAVVPIPDGRPGELIWKSGYRGLAERLDDGTPISSLTLPRVACSAQALLAFGSASSDGAPDANTRLARRRALWAAEWARKELASCPPAGPAPAILAISLGQGEGPPAARQRIVRLVVIKSGAGPLLASGGAQLRRSSAAIFPDIQSFSAFEACVASGPTAPGLNIAPCR